MSAKKRSRSWASGNVQDESGDSDFNSEAPKRAKRPSKSRKTSSGKDQEEYEQQSCQSRETDHEVVANIYSIPGKVINKAAMSTTR
jgi:hypothetical protein